MYHIPLKSWMHHTHTPHRHNMGAKMQSLFRDERFWAIFAIVVIMALLITLAIVAGKGTGASPDFTPIYPYYP
jgi:hypothetical protein